MFKTLTKTLCTAATLSLAACAAPNTPSNHQNQPHLPPPAFPISEVPVEKHYCGVRMVGGGSDICMPKEFCRRTIADQCGAADAPGICSTIPQDCTMEYAPVCGCDGQTYSNECVANSKGVSPSYKGEC